MATETGIQPLTLQELCLLHLVSNLEQFPVELLAQLSSRVRQWLMVNLPAVDICRLEGTLFAEGIEVDNVWKEVFAVRMLNIDLYDPPEGLLTLSKICSVVSTRFGWKEAYFTVLLFYLLNDASHSFAYLRWYRFSTLLFGVEHMLGIQDWTNFESILKWEIAIPPVPQRYLHFYYSAQSEACIGPDITYYLVSMCNYHPQVAFILLHSFMWNTKWFNDDNYWNLVPQCSFLRRGSERALSDLLNGVRELLFSMNDENSASEVLVLILRSVLCGNFPVLEDMGFLNFDINVLEDCLMEIAPFLVPDYENSQGRYIKPYTGLQSLALESTSPVVSKFLAEPELALIIESHKQLHSLALAGMDLHCSSLASTLVDFVARPTFKCLELRSIVLPSSVIGTVLHVFLRASGCCEFTTQTLSLFSVTFAAETRPVAIEMPIVMSEVGSKSLVLEQMELPKIVTESIFHPASALRFHTLVLSNPLPHQDTTDPDHLLALISDHPNFLVRHLNLSGIPIPILSPQVFDRILASEHLQSLSLNFCQLGTNSLSPLASAIMKSSLNSRISRLDLVANDLGKLPDSEVQFLFEAISYLFALQPISNTLFIDLGNNGLKKRHFDGLYVVLRKLSGSRRRQLHITYVENELPPDYKKLEELEVVCCLICT